MTAPVIRAIYAQVGAPEWAAPNLDALADVLRDLGWLPEGPVLVTLPDLGALTDDERLRLLGVLVLVVAEAAGSARPVRIDGAH